MEVKYTGETKPYKTTKGDEEVKIENSKVYRCLEKEYHSGTFVRLVLDSGKHVKVKRSDLQKV
ncbi:MAG: hypothetical protein PVJ36_00195 [Nitrospirota bacterium]